MMSRTRIVFWLTLGLGIFLRVALVMLVVPVIQTEWFGPFFRSVLTHPSIDPWAEFLASGGDPRAFPYGPVMVAFFGLATALTSWLPAQWGVQIGIAMGLLLLEAAMWAIAAKWVPDFRRRVFIMLVASPIVIYASFVHGQLDLLPTVLMFAGMYFLSSGRWYASGLFMGLAISAKFSSFLLPPLVLIFLLRNVRYRAGVGRYLWGLVPGLALTVAPLALPGYWKMVVLTPTTNSLIAYAINLGPGLTIVVLPIVFAGLLALQYRSNRGNPDLVVLLAGIALTAVTLLTPASPGWYIWSVPFLIVLSSSLSRRVRTIIWTFWAVATVTLALRASGATWRFLGPAGKTEAFREVGPFIHQVGSLGAILSTATVVLGVGAIVLVYVRAKPKFDLYRLSEAPFAVAIAGDSGTGKDTLCLSLSEVFGEQATSFVMGDDYHRYDRQAPLWRATTHLHPGANELAAMARDALALMTGQRVRSKHYDHARGRFSAPEIIQPRELVVINGLHSLTSSEIRDRVDVTVFTSMDETLRRRLKIDRDVSQRGQDLATVIESIERRYDHSLRFVQPQADLANVVLHLEPVSELPAEHLPLSGRPELRLVATLRDTNFAEQLHRSLLSLANCPAQLEYLDTPGVARLIIYPEHIQSGDTAAIAQQLIDRPEELFLHEPRWSAQSVGMIQLIVVLAMLDRRKSKHRRRKL